MRAITRVGKDVGDTNAAEPWHPLAALALILGVSLVLWAGIIEIGTWIVRLFK